MYFINVYPVFVGARDVGTRYQASEFLYIYIWHDVMIQQNTADEIVIVVVQLCA